MKYPTDNYRAKGLIDDLIAIGWDAWADRMEYMRLNASEGDLYREIEICLRRVSEEKQRLGRQ